MYAKGTGKGTVRFAFKPPRAGTKVLLAGSFDGWKPRVMRKQKDGTYSATADLRPGTYEYKFIVDEEWIVDPDNPTWSMNPYGTFNSVAQVTA